MHNIYPCIANVDPLLDEFFILNVSTISETLIFIFYERFILCNINAYIFSLFRRSFEVFSFSFFNKFAAIESLSLLLYALFA